MTNGSSTPDNIAHESVDQTIPPTQFHNPEHFAPAGYGTLYLPAAILMMCCFGLCLGWRDEHPQKASGKTVA